MNENNSRNSLSFQKNFKSSACIFGHLFLQHNDSFNSDRRKYHTLLKITYPLESLSCVDRNRELLLNRKIIRIQNLSRFLPFTSQPLSGEGLYSFARVHCTVCTYYTVYCTVQYVCILSSLWGYWPESNVQLYWRQIVPWWRLGGSESLIILSYSRNCYWTECCWLHYHLIYRFTNTFLRTIQPSLLF